MKKYLDILYPVIIFALLAYAFKTCESDNNVNIKPEPTRTIVKVTDTIYLEKEHTDTIIVRVPGSTVYVPLPGNTCPELDSIKVFKDTLILSDDAMVSMIDSVRGYRISLSIKGDYTPRIIKETTTITDSIPYPYCLPKNQFFAGGTINSNFALGIQGSMVTKKGYMLNAGYNTDKEITLGVGIKLFNK